jgi:hypothetical protein
MSAPLISLSELGGLPGVAPPSDPQADLQNGVDNANNVASQGLNNAAGAVKNPGIPFDGMSTKIDPETGEQTHDVKGMKDWFLQQAAQAIQFKNQAIAAYDAQIKQQQAKQQFLTEHPGIAQVGRLASLAAAAYADPRSRYAGLIKGAGVFGMDTFGQSPEQIGANISQLQLNKLGAQEGVTNILEKGAAFEERSADRQAALAETHARNQEQISRDTNNERIRIIRDAGSAARTGAFDPESYTQARVALGDNPIEVAQSAKAIAAQQDAIKATQEQRDQSKDDRANARLDKTLSFQRDQLAATLASHEKIAANALAYKEQAAKAATGKVPPAITSQLEKLSFAENSLDKIATVLDNDKVTKYMGPLKGPTVGRAASYLGADDVKKAMTLMDLETATAINATGAGARGFGPQERPFFKQLSTGFNNTPDQNRQILSAWRDRLQQERRAILASFPGTASNPAAFGHDSALAGPSTGGASSAPAQFDFDPKSGKLVPRAQ